MTDKKTNMGQPAPESKHAVIAELEKSAFLTGAVIASTIRFAVIFGCAAALGYLLDYAHECWPFVPGWMISVGHFVEGGLYVFDVISFGFDVTLHFCHYMKHKWPEVRELFAKHKNG